MNNQSSSHSYLPAMSRRVFLRSAVTGLVSLSLPPSSFAVGVPPLPTTDKGKPVYRGPHVILVRFGGGVRRQETIDPTHTFSPFLCHELIKCGVLFKHMEISGQNEVETNHRQGTLNLLTGKYDRFKDISYKGAEQRFEAQVPTLFEYLRKQYAVPTQQALIISDEDHTNEEFSSFSNHHLFGTPYRPSVLSLSRYKTYVLRQQLENGAWASEEKKQKKKELAKLEALDHSQGTEVHDKNIGRFWERWRYYYGKSGLLNPYGDRLLTALAVHALRELRPTLLMIQYNDPDYVHWGNRNHYTQGIAIIDEGLQQLVIATQADEEYRHNTIFVIVPDCGRDDNPFAAVPYQHHCNSRSAHEIFALFFGPGIAKGVVVNRRVEQISVAATIGQLMGFPTNYAEGPVLAEVMA